MQTTIILLSCIALSVFAQDIYINKDRGGQAQIIQTTTAPYSSTQRIETNRPSGRVFVTATRAPETNVVGQGAQPTVFNIAQPRQENETQLPETNATNPEFNITITSGNAGEQLPAQQGQPVQAQSQPGQVQVQIVQPGQAQAQIQAQPGQVQTQPAQVQTQAGQIQTQPEQVQAQPEQVQTQPEQVQTQPAQVQTQPAQVQTQAGQIQTQPEQVQTQPEQSQIQPAETQTAVQTQTAPVQVQIQPAQVQTQPEQAQATQQQGAQNESNNNIQIEVQNQTAQGQPALVVTTTMPRTPMPTPQPMNRTEFPSLEAHRDQCQFTTRTIDGRQFLFSHDEYSYTEAVAICNQCAGSVLADIHAAVLTDTLTEPTENFWIGSYDGGNVVPFLMFGMGANPFVVVVEPTSVRHRAICEFGHRRPMRSFCTYLIIDTASGFEDQFPIASERNERRGPCWRTGVRDSTGDVVPGASARICFADFNVTDLSEGPTAMTQFITLTLPNNDSFTAINRISVAPLQDLQEVPSRFTNFLAASNSIPVPNFLFGINPSLGTGEFRGLNGADSVSGFLDISRVSADFTLRFNEVMLVDWAQNTLCFGPTHE